MLGMYSIGQNESDHLKWYPMQHIVHTEYTQNIQFLMLFGDSGPIKKNFKQNLTYTLHTQLVITINNIHCVSKKRAPFLQRVSIASYAERCISHDRFCLTVCLTVCLSVTVRYHAKTTPAKIMRSSLEDSPMTLVSSTLDFTAKFQGEHRERGRRMREG